MKTALALNGNLRTFFMPTRDNPEKRVCDFLKDNIVSTDTDVYVCCDISDFYMDGTVYYVGDIIETTNNNGFRVYKNIKFITIEIAREMIITRLNQLFSNIKVIEIVEKNTPESHPHYLDMKNCGYQGVAVELLINQHNKIQKLKTLIEASGIKYDFIFRTRFDFIHRDKLMLNKYKIEKNIVYVPGYEGNRDLCYDFYIFGEAETVLKCMNLYNELNFYKPIYAIRCPKCPLKFITVNTKCAHGTQLHDVSLSSETQLARIFRNNKIIAEGSKMKGALYRYYPDSITKTALEILPTDISGIKIVDYSASGEISSKYL